MKKFISFILAFGVLSGLSSCKEDEPNDVIWDYYPIYFQFYVHNTAGRNLLDPATDGNILDQEIYINYNGEKIYPFYGWPDPSFTRAFPSTWYGMFIAPAFTSYVPDLGNAIYFGEFDGTSDDRFELVVCGNSYDINFTNDIQKGGEIDRRYFMNGHQVRNSSFYLRLDENLKDINYLPKK